MLTRRKFIRSATVASVGGTLVFAGPAALANHPQPTKPIVYLRLRGSWYPKFRKTTITNDPELRARWAPFNIIGSPAHDVYARYNWDRIRLEADVEAQGNPNDSSIHFRVDHKVSGPVPGAGGNLVTKLHWDDSWPRASIGPHVGNSGEVIQSNHYRMKEIFAPGRYEWQVIVTDVNGNELSDTLTWEVPNEPEDPFPT